MFRDVIISIDDFVGVKSSADRIFVRQTSNHTLYHAGFYNNKVVFGMHSRVSMYDTVVGILISEGLQGNVCNEDK